MQRDDVRLAHQLVQGDIGYAHVDRLLLGMGRAGDDLASECLAKVGDTQANGPRAHDPHGFAPPLTADQPLFGSTLAACRVGLRDLAQQGDHDTEGQLRHRLGRITRRIGNLNVTLLAQRHVHVIHPGKSHGDKLELWAGRDDLAGKLPVGDHQDIRVLSPFNHLGDDRGFLVGGKGMALCEQRRRMGVQHFLRYPQGFQQNNIHNPVSLKIQ